MHKKRRVHEEGIEMAVEPLNPKIDQKELLKEGRKNLETYMKKRPEIVRKNNRAVAVNTIMMIVTILGMGQLYYLNIIAMFLLGMPILTLYFILCHIQSKTMLMCEHLDRTIDLITAINYATNTGEKEEDDDDLPGRRA